MILFTNREVLGNILPKICNDGILKHKRMEINKNMHRVKKAFLIVNSFMEIYYFIISYNKQSFLRGFTSSFFRQ